MHSNRWWQGGLLLGLSGMVGCGTEAPSLGQIAPALVGSLGAGGAMSCDFELPASMDPNTIGPIIERDRMYMAAQPGMQRKYIPFLVDLSNGNITTGGRYLFQTHAQATTYLDWVTNSYVLDGVHFFDRPYFLGPVCHAWSVIGARDFSDVHLGHNLIRTERYSDAHRHERQFLEVQWPSIANDAQARGLSGVRLLYDRLNQLVELTYVADRSVTDLLGLETIAPLGGGLLPFGYEHTFDRTQFVLTTWFPFVLGDQGEPSLWSNSPPLPAPSCDDGVCEVSRGESYSTCAGDCRPQCGDAVCQPAQEEDTHNCPGDCRL